MRNCVLLYSGLLNLGASVVPENLGKDVAGTAAAAFGGLVVNPIIFKNAMVGI